VACGRWGWGRCKVWHSKSMCGGTVKSRGKVHTHVKWVRQGQPEATRGLLGERQIRGNTNGQDLW